MRIIPTFFSLHVSCKLDVSIDLSTKFELDLFAATESERKSEELL